MNISEKLFRVYAKLFGRKIFTKFNKFLYHLSLRGLGVLNFQEENVTQDEVKWLKSYIPKIENPVIFDVGANVGEYSKLILSLNKISQIYAFEPHPGAFKKLKSSINFPNFKAINVGVGHEGSETFLYSHINDTASAHSSLYEDVFEVLHHSKSAAQKVQIVTLDKIVQEHKIDRIDLLKIDTEGHELAVLTGALESIKNLKVKAIHFEFNEMNIVSKTTFRDFWNILVDYKLYRLLYDGSLLELKEYSTVNCEIYAYQSIIAILNKLESES